MESPLVSVVFISFNRVKLLQRTFEAFRECCTYPNLEFILSDDGSCSRQRELMFRMGFDRLVFASRNEGMGANINKGIQAARGDYIIHLEDDWICNGGDDFVEQAIEIFGGYPDVGCIKFNPCDYLPLYEERSGPREQQLHVFSHNQPESRHSIYVYSNNPHIKRKPLHYDIGWYIEGQPVGITEDSFCRLFLKQDKWRVATVEGWHLFKHLDEELSTRSDRWRQNLRNRFSKNPATKPLVSAYYALPLNIRRAVFWPKR